MQLGIEDKNNLIAFFMGWEVRPMFMGSDLMRNHYIKKEDDGNIATVECAYFTIDYNLLMSVVEKIESLSSGNYVFKIDKYSVGFDDYSESVVDTDLIEVDRREGEKPLKECILSAIIQFIEWHNKKLLNIKTMRKKEGWMFKGAFVIANGKRGSIDKMDENTINGIEYVYYIYVKLEGNTRSQPYHPSDVEKLP